MKELSYGIVPYLIINQKIYILMCQSSKKQKFGFVKGKIESGETIIETALREFKEEVFLDFEKDYIEDYFFQEYTKKNIGVFLYNLKNYKNYKIYFKNKKLIKFNKENVNVNLFDINNINFEFGVSNNQKIITNNIILHFKQNKQKYLIANKFFK
jgi:ADP-ribose pyrophosphatase YjhB (NUDIX family)